jgi:hypothetical protein
MMIRPREAVCLAAVLFLTMGTAWLAPPDRATAETFPLKIQTYEKVDPTSGERPADAAIRSVSPQFFHISMADDLGEGVRIAGQQEELLKQFEEVVTKEPDYRAEKPLKFVATLAGKKYPFALDASEASLAAYQEAQKKAKEAQEKEKKEGDSEQSSTQKLLQYVTSALQGERQEERPPAPPTISYDLLYFDLNGNGDLTDDDPIEGEQNEAYPPQYSAVDYHAIPIELEVDDETIDYHFNLSAYVYTYPIPTRSGDSTKEAFVSRANCRLSAAAYAKGEIEVDGEKISVALVDFNSNGRYDDPIEIRDDVQFSNNRIYTERGDVLVLNPENTGATNPYDLTASSSRINVCDLVRIKDHFFKLSVDPAGTSITLNEKDVKTGTLACDLEFRAMLAGETCIFTVHGTPEQPAELPEGEWKLIAYTMFAEMPEKENEEDEKESDDSVPPPRRRGPMNMVSATGTIEGPMLEVVAGESVAFPFGPPFLPKVDAMGGAPQMRLGLTITGQGGEVLTDLRVDGGRPPKPTFTIKTTEGDEVASGNFEYG